MNYFDYHKETIRQTSFDMPQQKITSYDVAKLAGVSQTTVSRAFDPNGNVAPATRTKVLETAKQLGYEPNVFARGLTTDRTNIIGIVMGDISWSLFYPKVLDLLTKQLQASNKQVLFFNAHNTRSVDEILPRVMSYQVDALVMASTTPGHEIVDRLTAKGVPIILINRILHDSKANSVCSDNEAGGRLAADVLLEAGSQRLAYIAGTRVTSTNILRESGFTARLQEVGYDNLLFDEGNYTYESGYESALRLLDRDDPPDGIFCAADILALGVMDAARYKLGIRIPEELSIIGYDDIAMAGWSSYNLTTIRQPIQDLVHAVVDIITAEPVTQGELTGSIQLMDAQLVRRYSVRGDN